MDNNYSKPTSFAGGTDCQALGDNSFAFGNSNTVYSINGTAFGSQNTVLSNNEFIAGRGAITKNITNNDSDSKDDILFLIGCGSSYDSSTYRDNAFSINGAGVVKTKSTITANTSADYAELFEWEDGNPNNEDRVGRFVTLNGDKIRIANNKDDYILGVISGRPFLLGNGDCDVWTKMIEKDPFGRDLYEDKYATYTNQITGEEKFKINSQGQAILYGNYGIINPEYDPTQKYISRLDRPEWAPVGMLGVLAIYTDGTPQVNGYCKCDPFGLATASELGELNSYRVIKKLADNIVQIILK